MYTEEHIKQEQQSLKNKADEKLNSDRAAAFNAYKSSLEKEIEKVNNKLQPDNVDYLEKTYKSTKVANILNMLEVDQLPDYINQLNDRTKLEEFTKLTKVKLLNEPFERGSFLT
jgi:alanyl-tRNA synthetase